MRRVRRVTTLAIGEIRALPHLDDVTVRVADVAPYLAVLFLRLGDELGSSTLPELIASLNISNADIQEAADLIRVGGDAEGDGGLIRSGRPRR